MPPHAYPFHYHSQPHTGIPLHLRCQHFAGPSSHHFLSLSGSDICHRPINDHMNSQVSLTFLYSYCHKHSLLFPLCDTHMVSPSKAHYINVMVTCNQQIPVRPCYRASRCLWLTGSDKTIANIRIMSNGIQLQCKVPVWLQQLIILWNTNIKKNPQNAYKENTANIV